jgi:hypothetical protein
MLGSLLKAISYGQAPKTTFAMLHPEAAFQLVKMRYDLRHAYAPRVSALVTLLVALPLGIALGRVMERDARRRGGDVPPRVRAGRQAERTRPPLPAVPRQRVARPSAPLVGAP